MPRSRAPRLARGAVAASIATFVALLSHTAAGGAMPGPVGVFVPWVLAVAVSTMLAGRTLSLPRLAVAVTASQMLFHTLFVLGMPSMASQQRSAFHIHDYASIAVGATGFVHADVAMWVGHAVAALLTVAALHRGERSVRSLLSLARETVATFRRRVAVLTASDARPAASLPRIDVSVVRPLSHHETTASRRGPPSLLPA